METAVKPTRRVFEMPPADGSIQFQRTPRDAGVECELKLTRYDKGIWQLNGRPIADGAPDVLTVLAFVVTTMDRSGQA
jgi:hypothetical protein